MERKQRFNRSEARSSVGIFRISLIFTASVLIGWGFYDATHQFGWAFLWGAGYLALRSSLDLRRRGLSRSRKLVMAITTLVASVLHAFFEMHDLAFIGPQAVFGLVFLMPEVILWAVEDRPRIPGLTYRVLPNASKIIELGWLVECYVEIRIDGKDMRKLRTRECIAIAILNGDAAEVEDLGVLTHAHTVESSVLKEDYYCVRLTNNCDGPLDLEVWIYTRNG